MKEFYGYIRVSTVKQGTHGVSLQEQKDAILRYARRSNIEVIAWFEEQLTAAKQGRPVFLRMMSQLRQGKAKGVILHKIDRGARNLKDWASIGELTEQGIEVHLASDGLDMKSRGGRLSADIQAVIAADYIRNLREETLKGFYGRLKQGILPIAAPLGYLNNGGGKPKTPDPVKAPLIKKAFELYATGQYTFHTLPPILKDLGLRNVRGKPVIRSSLTSILTNEFYYGLIRIKKTGEIFKGIHEPIITKTLFDQVQAVLAGKSGKKIIKHDFLFRRLLRCQLCQKSLIGEKQKGHHYYRCQNKECPMTCIREEVIAATIQDTLKFLSIDEALHWHMKIKVQELRNNVQTTELDAITGFQIQLKQIRDRLNRVTDAMIDGTIEKGDFISRKNSLIQDQKEIEEKLDTVAERTRALPDILENVLELLKSLDVLYEKGNPLEKRRILNSLTSNLFVSKESIDTAMVSPYGEILKYTKSLSSALGRNRTDIRPLGRACSIH